MNILISDEQLNGTITHQFEIQIEQEVVTAKALIENRVRQEVQDYNQKLPEQFNGLVEPSEVERTLNRSRLKKRQPIDAEKQVYVALAAFQKNGFFILADDQQLENLEQEVTLTPHTKISFIKLTPLVGG